MQDLPSGEVEVVKGKAGDPELVQWDTEISGRYRPQDHAYWVRQPVPYLSGSCGRARP
jgi:hypothetical protein